MKNQNDENNQNDGSSSLLQWGFLGLLSYGVVHYLNYLGTDSVIENPEPKSTDKNESAQEPETKAKHENGEERRDTEESEEVRKYSEEIGEEINMKVRKSNEPQKGTWLAILCRADGKESNLCFYGETKNEAIEDAFQEAISAYKEAFEE